LVVVVVETDGIVVVVDEIAGFVVVCRGDVGVGVVNVDVDVDVADDLELDVTVLDDDLEDEALFLTFVDFDLNDLLREDESIESALVISVSLFMLLSRILSFSLL
jgi:hypothetical protein